MNTRSDLEQTSFNQTTFNQTFVSMLKNISMSELLALLADVSDDDLDKIANAASIAFHIRTDEEHGYIDKL